MKRVTPTFASPSRFLPATGDTLVKGEPIELPDEIADWLTEDGRVATLTRVSQPVRPPAPAEEE
jgi:hypothetical protein